MSGAAPGVRRGRSVELAWSARTCMTHASFPRSCPGRVVGRRARWGGACRDDLVGGNFSSSFRCGLHRCSAVVPWGYGCESRRGQFGLGGRERCPDGGRCAGVSPVGVLGGRDECPGCGSVPRTCAAHGYCPVVGVSGPLGCGGDSGVDVRTGPRARRVGAGARSHRRCHGCRELSPRQARRRPVRGAAAAPRHVLGRRQPDGTRAPAVLLPRCSRISSTGGLRMSLLRVPCAAPCTLGGASGLGRRGWWTCGQMVGR